MNIMDNCTSGTARKKDVKYLKCVDDNCPSRTTLKNGNTRITTEHAQHDAVTEEISQLKIVGLVASNTDNM